MVEPAFIVLKSRPSPTTPYRAGVRILLADEGAEERAIRALRLPVTRSGVPQRRGWELFRVESDTVSSASWLPRPARYLRLMERLAEERMPTVRALFHVRQGVRTGKRAPFMLSRPGIMRLPRRERDWFRPVAGTRTIRAGMIHPDEFIFYPYDSQGLALKTEPEVRAALPTYFAECLQPARAVLECRAGVDPQLWWALVRPRPWEWWAAPKLVTKAFGARGGFAYDDRGGYVVVQGFSWVWRGDGEADEREPGFLESDLPWAYLALLNSGVFEALLACCCPRVQGGQFELTGKYVDRVFIPDLCDDLGIPSGVSGRLAELGHHIHAGRMPAAADLDAAVAPLYGISPEDAVQLAE
jgi:hypothetical protein